MISQNDARKPQMPQMSQMLQMAQMPQMLPPPAPKKDDPKGAISSVMQKAPLGFILLKSVVSP